MILGFEVAGKEALFRDVISKGPGKVVFVLDRNRVICWK